MNTVAETKRCNIVEGAPEETVPQHIGARRRLGVSVMGMVCLGALLAACGTGSVDNGTPMQLDAEMHFAAWRDTLPRTDSGAWIVEGDIGLFSEEELRVVYERGLAIRDRNIAQQDGLGVASSALTIDANGSNDDDHAIPVLSRHSLTYCIEANLAPYQSIVEAALEEATAEWEKWADVRFEHLAAEDGVQCNLQNNNVFFSVRWQQSITGGRASMNGSPTGARNKREMVISQKAIDDELISKTDRRLGPLLMHEVGHLLGFKHEHDRELQCMETCVANDSECSLQSNGFTCQGGFCVPPTRLTLTPLDRASVMYYGCLSTRTGDYALTDLDRLGAMCIYARGLSRAACGNDRTGQDYLWRSNGGGSFIVSPQSKDGLQIPLSGDFDGDGFGDIFWYGRGNEADSIQWGGIFGLQNPVAKQVMGLYDPLVGDFNGDGRDDILWYGLGAGADVLWSGNANRSFTSSPMSIVGSYQPIVADFDGNGCDDIFWYGPDSGADSIWYFDLNGSYQIHAQTVNGNYRPVAGDFDGDGRGDVLWHEPNADDDPIWWGRTTRGTFDKGTKTTTGKYYPFSGDFDGDGRDEIFWYGPGSDPDVLWDIDAQRGHSSRVMSVNGFYSPVSGDFNGDGGDDIYWYAPLSP